MMTTPSSPPNILAITLGDPLSINACALIRALQNVFESSLHKNIKIIFMGKKKLFLRELSRAEDHGWCSQKLTKTLKTLPTFSDASSHNHTLWNQVLSQESSAWVWLEGSKLADTVIATSMSQQERGKASAEPLFMIKDLSEYLHSHLPNAHLAVLTAPVDKFCLKQAGFEYGGQSEFFESIWKSPGIMVLAGDHLRVGLLSHHIPLREASSVLSIDLIIRKSRLFYKSLAQLRDRGMLLKKEDPTSPLSVALCGLNPHLSDGGLIGDEEKTYFEPAVKILQKEGMAVDLLSADSAYYKAYKGEYQGVLAAYHDQGLAPLKMLEFERAINMTLGLRHFRVAPAHGPASELYGRADFFYGGFLKALQSCINYLQHATQRNNGGAISSTDNK